jgi:anti-anti-sigma factor
MNMEITEISNGLVSVTLIGRLDSPGVERIELQLTGHVVPRAASTLVDLSGVEFVGSMAIRMFITLARALAKRNAVLLLHSPQPLVYEVFETASLHDIIPVHPDAETAAAAAVR